MPQYRCQRTINSVNSLLNALLKCGAFDKAKEVLTRVGEFGKPDACTYNVLISGYSQSGCFDEAVKLFDEMVERKVKPTGVTFGTLMHGLCKYLKVKEALKMNLAFKLKDEVKVDSTIYYTLISLLIKDGRSNEVPEILEEMREKGWYKPRRERLERFLQRLCENEKLEILGIVISSLNEGNAVDAVKKEVKEALKMKHDMLKVYGVFPTVHIYASLIKALCQDGELGLAFKLKDEVKADSAIYSTLISSLIKAGRRGCVPDVLSYRIVFDGLCEGLQFEEAAVILDEMMFKGYKPRRDRLERFLQRLCESEKMEILGDVISSLNKGNAYDADFWKSVLKGVGRLDFPAKQARGMNLGVKMVQKKVAVLYHYPCHDGVFAALAAHLYFSANSISSLFFPNTVYSPITISKLPLQDISHLYLLDFTGPPGFVQQVSPKVDNVVILDHHKTAIESLGDVSSTCKNVTKVLDIGRSGATIAFDYFTQKLKEERNCREMDEFKRTRRVFEYIEDADIWKWNLPESKAFNSRIIDLGIEHNFNQNSSLFQQLLSLDHDTVINRGRESLSRKRKLIQEALEQSYEIVLGGGAEEFGRCLAVNEDEIAELRSELGNQLAEKSKGMRLRGVGAVVYRVPELGDETKLKISLRSVEEEDTTVVSQRFGGGGHKNASSFLLSSTEFEQWKVKRNSCSYTLN
ncbi:hypothetical protein Bca101_008194 [Brassica carinata]